jgi:hypothetical protein
MQNGRPIMMQDDLSSPEGDEGNLQPYRQESQGEEPSSSSMSGYDLKGMFSKANKQQQIEKKRDSYRQGENLSQVMMDNSGLEGASVEYMMHRKMPMEYSDRRQRMDGQDKIEGHSSSKRNFASAQHHAQSVQ